MKRGDKLINAVLKVAKETRFKLVAIDLENGQAFDLPILDGVDMILLPNKLAELTKLPQEKKYALAVEQINSIKTELKDRFNNLAKLGERLDELKRKTDQNDQKVGYKAKALTEQEARMFG